MNKAREILRRKTKVWRPIDLVVACYFNDQYKSMPQRFFDLTCMHKIIDPHIEVIIPYFVEQFTLERLCPSEECTFMCVCWSFLRSILLLKSWEIFSRAIANNCWNKPSWKKWLKKKCQTVLTTSSWKTSAGQKRS